MTKISKFPQSGRKPRPPRPEQADDAFIARCRELVDNSIGLTFDNDGAGSPDWALLDICASALSFLLVASRAMDARAHLYEANTNEGRGRPTQEERVEEERLLQKAAIARRSVKPLLSRARKIRAKTGAGIFAKALLVRDSRTGAPALAKSLAEDLISQPALRASLWPVIEGGGA
jgi:hypothetical protein